MEEFLKKLVDMGTSYGGKILLAIAVLVIGFFVIKLICKFAGKAIDRSKLNDTAKSLVKKVIKILLYLLLLALLASAGLAVGLAFQGALSNLAGGFMILIFRPFKIGDYIESTGAEGTVKDISIFYTKLTTIDNKVVLVPNGDLMNANVTNFTASDRRRVDQNFKITNDIDQELVKRVLLEATNNTEGVIKEPAPFARLTAVDDDTYIFTIRAWCETSNYWNVYFDLIENCSKALAENGIDDPEERIAVRLVNPEKED